MRLAWINPRNLPGKRFVLVTSSPNFPRPENAWQNASYRFGPSSWQGETLEVLLNGKSMLDLTEGLSGFSIHSYSDAQSFLECYGYDLTDPIEEAELVGNLREAVDFIQRFFLKPNNPEGAALEIPKRFHDLTDVRELILYSVGKGAGQAPENSDEGLMQRRWACAILKVVHTIAHMDRDLRSSYFTGIQQQILDRYYKKLHRDGPDQPLYFASGPSDPHRVQVVAFQPKPKKTRDSTLIKLLHKAENVAEDIFDRVGIRVITETPLDTLRVIRFLVVRQVIMPANIKPSRSRNTLIDLPHFREEIKKFFDGLENNTKSDTEILEALGKFVEPARNPGGGSVVNPHTSSDYRSIQFTCRQSIKIRNPMVDAIREVKHVSRGVDLPDYLQQALDKLDLRFIQRETRFFYPYEVQIVDRTSHEENERGRSAHREYKRAQMRSAMKRVLGSLLPPDVEA
jgi:uncharacterized protein (TIGR04562 family)